MALQAHAWGRRGHSIICQTAAALLANQVQAPVTTSETGSAFLKKHSFDLGYYCNVPDLIWKKPTTYAVEAPQHFMDLEVFQRAFSKPSNATLRNPFELSRAEFEKLFPEIPLSAGRSYWRIRELMTDLDATSVLLRELPSTANQKMRFELQEKWLITAGAIGHYVGDLSQPLHVTEDFDGQIENQKGIHAFFEDQLVDELSSTNHPGRLEDEVGEISQAKWKTFSRNKRAELSVLFVVEGLARDSNENRSALLKIDKRVGRKDLKKAALAFEPMIKERLAAGAVALAKLWARELGWVYDGDKFYNFTAAPEYVYPLGSTAPSERAAAVKARAEAPTGQTLSP